MARAQAALRYEPAEQRPGNETVGSRLPWTSSQRTELTFRFEGSYARLVGQDTDARSDDCTFYAAPIHQDFSRCATYGGAYDSALKI